MHARFRLLVAAGLVLALAVGCSSDDGDDEKDKETTTTVADDSTDTTADAGSDEAPTAEELAAGLQSGLNMTEETATCVADKLKDELSGADLQAVADADPESADDIDAVRTAITEATADCG